MGAAANAWPAGICSDVMLMLRLLRCRTNRHRSDYYGMSRASSHDELTTLGGDRR